MVERRTKSKYQQTMKAFTVSLAVTFFVLLIYFVGFFTEYFVHKHYVHEASIGEAVKAPELRPLDWWENTVIYQIYLRSFQDSDGDGIGDLKGLTNKLEYFVESGIKTIWLSPIWKSPMVDFGYDVNDFYGIHYEYGTMDDLQKLLKKAHRLGLKVVLDFVANHASIDSEYFKRSAAREPGYENFFVWADPKPDPNNASNRLLPSNWISDFEGPIWEWNEIRQQYYLHQFAKTQADFNFREPGVRKELINIMRYWLDQGVDGFRTDALPHLFESNPALYGGIFPDEPLSDTRVVSKGHIWYTTREHTKDLMEVYDVVYEWRDFVEQWKQEKQSETKTMLYYGDKTIQKNGSHFPFNFDFVTALSAQSNACDFVYIISRWLIYMPRGSVANWVLGNHDNIRTTTRYGVHMIDGLNALTMMLPGVAVTYQGDEIGMRDGTVTWEETIDVRALNMGNKNNYMVYSRDPCRTPFHWDNSTSAGFSTSARTWLPLSNDFLSLNLAAQKKANISHYKIYQALTTLRKEPALSHGEYHITAISRDTLLLVRYLATFDSYALIFNVGKKADSVDLSKEVMLKDPMIIYMTSVHSKRHLGDSIPRGTVTLQPGEALILHLPLTQKNGFH